MLDIAGFPMPKPILDSWIEGFQRYTSTIMSPLIHRTWAAIVTVAGALERKVWLRSQGENIYPNMYVFLTGPPGSGKTRALMKCWELWRELPECKVAEISLTKAALIDTLQESRRVLTGFPEEDFNSLLIASPELGALLPAYDSAFMNTLTHLYDGHIYTERRRTIKEEFKPIEKPNLNLIACTTPSFLASSLPDGAWNEGFLARVCIAYSGEIRYNAFHLDDEGLPEEQNALRAALIHDLQLINQRMGKIAWTAPAIEAATAFHKQQYGIHEANGYADIEFPAIPSHPRLMHYTTRRPVHFLKLCMICACDRGAEYIDLRDVRYAIDLLRMLEDSMPDVFTAMASGGDQAVINDCTHWVMTENVHNDYEGVPMTMVREFLGARIPATHVERVVELMQRSGALITSYLDGVQVGKTKACKVRENATV